METELRDLVAVGRIGSTHGVRGQLRLHSYSGNLETLQSAKQITLKLAGGELRQYRLERAVLHSSRILLTIKDINDIDAASQLTGSELLVRQDQLPETDDNEYYWKDLIGLSVATKEGVHLGKLTQIMETGANDVYLVKDGRREYLIPAIADVIHAVDLASGTMIITPLEGLLDL